MRQRDKSGVLGLVALGPLGGLLVSVLVCKVGKMVPTSNGSGGVGKSGGHKICGRSLNTSFLFSPLPVPSEPHAPAGNKQQLWSEGWWPALLERRGVEWLRPAVLGPCQVAL